MGKISVVGLGKLGLCFAACAATKGFETIGVDINDNVISSINKGISPIIEPGLQDLISKVYNKNLFATKNHAQAIEKTDTTFILVATPSDPVGNFSNKYVEDALKELAQAFGKSKKKYHLFVISSTLMPTSTEERLIPILEKYSKRKLNKDFGVCYTPDFIALGSVIKDFLNPDLVVIGESNKTAGEKLASFYKTFCENNPPVYRMSIISAEIAKVSLNAYITLKISFANMLANICEKIKDADIDTITKAIGADKRISPYYLKGGLSYGGTCFPRDTRAFIAFSQKFGYDANLIKSVEKVNSVQDQHLAETVLKHIPEDRLVSILGLSFKPNTPIIEESPAIKLIRELLEKDLKVIVYDPLAMDNTMALFGDKILYGSSVKNCLANSSVCVITHQAEEFKAIDENCIVHNPTTIIDCWRMLDPARLGKKVKYVALGKS